MSSDSQEDNSRLPDFCLHFNKAVRGVSQTRSRLNNCGFHVTRSEDGRLLLISVPDSIIDQEAEHLRISKWNSELGDQCCFSKNDKHLFVNHRGDRDENKDSSLFTSAERQICGMSALRRVTVGEELSKSILKSNNSDNSLIDSLLHHELIFSVVPMHEDNKRKALWRHTRNLWNLSPPVESLRDYFGESVAFYFAWMNFYKDALIPLGILALCQWIISQLLGCWSIDKNPYVPFYTISVLLWGFLFVKFWTRCSNKLAFQWMVEDVEENFLRDIRPEFTGFTRISPITGKEEMHYPQRRRRIQYVISGLVTSIMLLVAFFFMICSLNLQGIVDVKTRFGDDNLFHIPLLHQYATAGQIFDPNGPLYLSLIPCILHGCVIFILNQLVYRQIATWLTDRENHKYEEDYERSLVTKRFFFDAFDSYVALFYIAFYEFDVEELRNVLLGLYTTDSLRRILLESIVPLILYRIRASSEDMVQTLHKKFDGDQVKTSLISSLQYKEVLADEYEDFDDYLEMVIQYGYIILFASACPLASFFSIITCIVETKSDLIKLLFITRKPLARRAYNIGMWEQIIRGLSWLAVLTNLFIFALSSEQLMQWCPWLFTTISLMDHDTSVIEQEIKIGAGRYVLGLIFCVEHLLVAVGLLINNLIKDIPSTIRNAKLRRQYLRSEMYLNSLKK